MEKKQVILYTDGACSYNPGPGGWAAVLLCGDAKKELSGGEARTTNNRMELMAAIKGLCALKLPCVVDIYTDSAYMLNAFEKRWIYAWKAKSWVKKDGEPVPNTDLWLELLRLCAIHEVSWHKVKGHTDDELNNRCDELARAVVKSVLNGNCGS